MLLLGSRFPTLEQGLNCAQGREVHLGERPPLLFLEAFGQDIGEGVDRDTDGHRLRIGELHTADHDLSFVLHGCYQIPVGDDPRSDSYRERRLQTNPLPESVRTDDSFSRQGLTGH